jgi:hypothetical protein
LLTKDEANQKGTKWEMENTIQAGYKIDIISSEQNISQNFTTYD